MGDRAYANIQVQQKTLMGSSSKGSLLQRTCACGQHTIAGGECSACRNKQSTLLRSQRTLEPPSAPGAVPSSSPAQENGPSFNSSFDRASRFGYNFSQIPIHSPVAGVLQTKLAINQPGDQYEQEADRLSEHVMRMPDPQLHRACACGGACPKCQIEQSDREHESLQTKRIQASDTGQMTAPPIVHEVLRSPGQPLDPVTRAFMEPRFGHDFSRVRVHSGAAAKQSARDVNAYAYTVGHNIVFDAGWFSPGTHEGRRLIAHELTHVVQQSGAEGIRESQENENRELSPIISHERTLFSNAGSAPLLGPSQLSVQRKCGPALGLPAPDCAANEAGVGGWQFLFKVGCDELLPGEAAKTSKFKTGSKLNIHGFASLEGMEDFNLDLSCHRANQIAALVRATRPDCPVDGVFKHGASPKPQLGAVPDPNPPAFWRSVIVEEVKAAPGPPPPTSTCGPDATDWFIDQVVAAKKNAKVLAVRSKLDVGAFFAPSIAPAANFDSKEILEGAVLEKVGEAWKSAGKPQPSADANMQMGQAQVGQLEFETAKMAALGLDANAITTLTALRDASLQWKALVGPRKPLDFKNDPSTMQNPKSAHCPDADCPKTITLCPGAPGLNCFEKDLPGNVLYATVGSFVGFQRNRTAARLAMGTACLDQDLGPARGHADDQLRISACRIR